VKFDFVKSLDQVISDVMTLRQAVQTALELDLVREPAKKLLAPQWTWPLDRPREQWRRLVLDGGLATAAPGITYAGKRSIKVTWLTITDVGRQALADM
jgi:hypothetical protein